MAESKMAAPTPDSKTADALNVAMCTTPIGPIRTPPGHNTPIAEDTTWPIPGRGMEGSSSLEEDKEDRKS